MDDLLGERCKSMEARTRGCIRLDPYLPIVARLDVRSGHTLTRGLDRPYDARFGDSIRETTRDLMRSRKAAGAYCQSDEITLIWAALDPASRAQLDFGGRVDKWLSTLAGEASVRFAREIWRRGVGMEATPHMDCRLMQPGTDEEMLDIIRWRSLDATRNGILAAAQKWIGRKRIHGMKESALLARLQAPDLAGHWAGLPTHARKGTFLTRIKEIRGLTAAEWERIPKHARKDRDLLIVRTAVTEVAFQEFLSHITGGIS